MYCTNCGAQMPNTTINCPQCGASMGTAAASAALSAVARSGAIKGFVVLVVSFFTMPLKTLRLTVHQLREVGGSGALQLGVTTLPHLSWLRVAGNLVASAVILAILAYGLYEAISALGGLKYSVKDALGNSVWALVQAVFRAIGADWAIGFVLELLGILVVISNDVRTISNRPG